MEFTAFDTATLTAMIHDAQGTALSALVPAMRVELKDRKAAEIKLAETTATRELAGQQFAMLSAVMASKVAEVASPEGTAYRRNYSALVALVEAGYDVNTLKARHAVTALVDKSAETVEVTDLDSAVQYANEHSKSAIYSA